MITVSFYSDDNQVTPVSQKLFFELPAAIVAAKDLVKAEFFKAHRQVIVIVQDLTAAAGESITFAVLDWDGQVHFSRNSRDVGITPGSFLHRSVG